MITHDVKIKKNYLKRLISGKKKSEIRVNDRDYQVGDVLKFTEYYTGPPLDYTYHFFLITHIHSGLGLADNHVCLSLEKASKK